MGSGASTNVGSIEKQNGDKSFQSGDYLEAVIWYTKCLQSVHDSSVSYDDLDAAVVYSNRSASFALSGQYERALEDATRAIDLQPSWPKGYFRAAKSLKLLNRNAEALEHLERAKSLCPENKDIDNEIASLHSSVEADGQSRVSQGCVFTWGLGDSHALGHSDGKDKHSPTMVEQLRGKHVVDISCGAMHTVAVTGTGEVYSWGDSKYGQAGIDRPDTQHYRLPGIVPGLLGVHVVAVSCGAGHTVVSALDGRVFSWGLGAHGQLGQGAADNVREPAQIQDLVGKDVLAVACGIAHTVFLLHDGSAWGCGMNTYGALGHDSNGASVLVPTPITVGENLVHISCGGAHTAFVDSDGNLFTTGSNTSGQLGLGNSCSELKTPGRVNVLHTQSGETLPPPVTRFAYVCCGEEFTVAITAERRVFTCGLGIAGQMGCGNTQDKLFFTHIPVLDGEAIEEVACSQGAVFAVSESGSVWTWGLPGAQHKETLTSGDDSRLVPTKAGVFSKRKKARQISCGRKHYALLTIIAYGHTSHPLKGLPLESPLVAGEKLKFSVQSRDVQGRLVEFSGSVLQGFLSYQKPEIAWVPSSSAPRDTPRVVIDDNFDGTFSGTVDSRLTIAGCYSLSLTIDGLHIRGSPFEVTVIPSSPCPTVSYLKPIGLDRVHESPLAVRSGSCVTFVLYICDKYGNRIDSPTETVSCLYADCRTSEGDIVVDTFKVNFHIDSEGRSVFDLNQPASPRLYEWHIGFNSTDNDNLVGGAPLRISATAAPYSPRMCNITLPELCTVDSDIVVSVEMRGEDGKPVCIDIRRNCPHVSTVITPLESDISARALVQLYKWQDDPCRPCSGSVQWEDSGTVARCITHLRVSGRANLEVSIGCETVLSTILHVFSGAPSSIFTEMINPRQALQPWMEGEDEREIVFQYRDQYGNKCTSGPLLQATIWLEGNESNTETSLNIVEYPAGKVGVIAKRIGDKDHPHLMKVEMASDLGAIEIQYSPFMISSNIIDMELDTTPPVVLNKTEEERKLKEYESLRSFELTKRRAEDALREERRKISLARERQRIKKAARRTGGGFVIQYSKDI